MTFTPESVKQLEDAGIALHKFIEGLTNGVNFDDAAAAFALAMQAQGVVDEFQADKFKAAAVLLGSAQASFGKS
jgi:zinc transporter ZupT